MNEYLVRHAIANVWCNPAQDRQFTYQLARLSPARGVWGRINLFYETTPLPTNNDRYHVYQIGAVLPKNLGFPNTTRRWLKLSTLANDHLLFTDVFVASGIQFPRFDTYVWITQARNLMIAVKINRRIADLEDQSLYLRVYSNAYFNSERSAGHRYIHCDGIQITSENQLLAFQQTVTTLVNQVGGYPFYYVNGRFVSNISPLTAMVGDVVEYVIDGSIKRMVEFPIEGLPAFTSTMDAVQKYILHYNDPTVDTIEYIDDVDAFLLHPGVGGRFMGVTYHRNRKDWMRMLTHKDYSIPSGRLDTFVSGHPIDPRHSIDPVRWPEDRWTTADELTLRLYIRHSGYHRPIGPESSRIYELYKLTSEQIVAAMTGDDSTLDLWRAENLEQCPYVRFMSLPPQKVYPINFGIPTEDSEGKTEINDLAGEVYGYFAAGSILAGTPSYTYSVESTIYADLAYEHWTNATVYEYDENGLLLGVYYHNSGQRYPVRNGTCFLVEAISGRATDGMNTHYGNTAVELPYGYNYRLYVTPRWAGQPLNDWRDITEAEDRDDYGYLDTTVKPHRWVWTADPQAWYGAVRLDDQFVDACFQLRKANGHLRFNITGREVHDGIATTRIMDIPFGQFDLFLNKRALKEGLDYVVHWPQVVISNLEYLKEGDYQDIQYRGFGFCNSDFTRTPAAEDGFVRHGVLSHNCRYNIHSYKVQRVVIDGRVFGPDEIVFDEENNQQTVEGVRNGAPYFIQYPPIIFKDVYGLDQVARREDEVRDQVVADYMSEKYPVPDVPPVDFIPVKYHVVSPFSNKLLIDLVNGFLYPDGIEGHYDEMQLRQWCADYEWLLDYDLALSGVNKTFVEVWPHWFSEPLELNLYQFQFYKRAMASYFQNPPNTADFIKLI